MRTKPLLFLMIAAALLRGGAALPCSLPSPDAGNGPDAPSPAGDFRVLARSVSPREGDLIPTNTRFTVTYSISVDAGATLAWLGDLTLRDATLGDIPVDVVRLPSQSWEARFQVTPRAPLPGLGSMALEDRFPQIPCGDSAVCERGERATIATYKVSTGPDVSPPSLASQTIVFSGWKPYSYTETCMNTRCAGFRATVQLPEAGDWGPVTYRFRYPDGTVYDSGSPTVYAQQECTDCFQLSGDDTRPPQLGPIEMTAVDWLGQESEGKVILTLTPPDCSQPPPADAGPPTTVDAGSTTMPPHSGYDAGTLHEDGGLRPRVDAGPQQANGDQPAPHGAGCAVGGGGDPAGWLAMAALLLVLRRRRPSCTPAP